MLSERKKTMKKKKIISALLALVMVFNLTLVAGETAKAADESTTPVSSTITNNLDPISDDETIPLPFQKGSRLVIDGWDYAETDPVPVTTMSTPDTTAPWDSYIMNPNQYILSPATAGSSGILYMDFKTTADINTDSISVYLLDKNGNIINNKAGSIPGSSTIDNGFAIPVTSKETFYLYIVSPETNSSSVNVQFRARIYRTSDRSLSEDTYLLSSGVDPAGYTSNGDLKIKSNSIYYKIKPSKTGLMTVTLKEYGYSPSAGTVSLYTSSKKALSEKISYNSSSNKAYFGVQKGVTYYLRVENCYGTESNNFKYSIKYTVSSRTTRDLASKSKAKTLTRQSSSVKTLFIASTSTNTDYYKFKVTSKRKTTKITVSTSGIKSGTVRVTVYQGSKKLNSKTINCASSTGVEWTASYAPTGTYYVKVVKGTKASGTYSIRYVQ